MFMWETEKMRIRFISRSSWLDFKFNSEFVALAINTSPWVHNLVLFFSKFLLFSPSLSFPTSEKDSFMGGPF